MSRSPAWSLAPRDLLALTLAAASWGVGTVISKRALDEFEPLALLPIQLASSLIVLAAVMRRQGLSFRDPGASPALGRLGVLNPGLGYTLSLLGLVSISASLSVLIWALEPLLILALAVFVLGERMRRSVVALSALAVTGMLLVIYDPSGGGHLLGVALTVAGVACCAVYTVVARRWIGTADSTAQVVLVQQAYAFAFASAVFAVLWLVGSAAAPTGVTPIGWLSAVASGVLYYAAAYWLYLTGLRGVPASLAAVSFYLIPVFGVAAGGLLLGERLDSRQWLGAVIVLGTVLAIAGRMTRRDRGDDPLPNAAQPTADRSG